MSFAFNVVRLNNVLQGGVMAPVFDRREDRESAGNDAQRHLTINRIRRTAPKASWQTIAVRTLFGVLGTGDEIPYVALDGTNGVELIGAKRATDGIGYASGLVHPRRRGLRGVAALSGLSWSKGRPLTATVDIFWWSTSGLTDAIEAADLIALPTLPVNTQQLGLTALLNGAVNLAAIADSLELTIDHRIENNVEPTCYHADQPHPVLNVGPGNNGPAIVTCRISTEDLDTVLDDDGTIQGTWTDLTNQGIGFGSNTASFALRGLTRETTIPGSDGSSARRIIETTGIYDGSNLPLTISTT